jgi:hypothetical protein
MLRRFSIHAAGLHEDKSRYVIESLCSRRFEDGIAQGFKRQNRALQEYAIAGVRQMSLFANLANESAEEYLWKHAILSASAIGLSTEETFRRLRALVSRHAVEWSEFLASLGDDSFVCDWARGVEV